MDEIKLIPCCKCGGQPIVLIRPQWPYPMVSVECSTCGRRSPIVYFCPSGNTWIQGLERILLPGLARARREAAACWNQENGS